MADSRPQPPAFISQQVSEARRFYLNLRPSARADLVVVCGGWEVCAANYAIDRATFPFHSIEFVASGCGDLVLGNESHPLTAGTVFSYSPAVAQRIRSSASQPLRKYFVDFAGRCAAPLLREIGLSPGTVAKVGGGTEVRRAFDTLIDTALEHDRFAERSARLQLELLMQFIARAAQAPRASSQVAARTFERCREYIDAEYRTIRTINDVARRCEVDVAYLTRLFQRFQAQSPLRYLQRLKYQWAAERLHGQGSRVKDVAAELGIDPFQFSRTFRRIHGVSPSEFLQSRN